MELQTQLFPEPTPQKRAGTSILRRKQVTEDSVVVRSHELMKPVWGAKPTTQVYRLLLTAIAGFDPNSAKPEEVCIARSTLFALFPEMERARLTHAKLVDTCKTLLTLQFHYDQGNGEIELRNAIEYARFKKGELRVSFMPRALPHLQAITGAYTAARLKYLRDLNTPYQFQLYDILSPHAREGVLELSLEDLRTGLSIPSSKYPNWQDFNRRVLSESVRAVDAVTDLQVSATPLKIDRSVVGVRFKITRKSLKQGPVESALVAMLVERGVNEKIAQERVYAFGVGHCFDRVVAFQVRKAKKSASSQELASPGAYLSSLLSSSNVALDDNEDTRKIAVNTRVELVMQLFAQHPPETREALLADFKHALPVNYLAVFDASGPEYPTIRPLWYRHLVSFFSDLLAPLAPTTAPAA